MYKFIVTWCIQIIGGCPQSTDEFGRISHYKPLAACITNECGHKKEFNSKDSSIAFYKNAKLQAGQFGYNELTNIKLDSVKND